MTSLILGIETSCDETAVAIVSSERQILSNLVRTQWEEHRPFGGVVPEIAARSHVEALDIMIADALKEAKVTFKDLNGIAATTGPGLIGGLIVGMMTAKAIASVHRLPFIAVNHLEGHALTVRLTHDVAFPFLLLLVSGGHCQLLAVKGVGQYERLGGTIDDALGEAFDKVAKMLGLPYPGGPEIEKGACAGNAARFSFPKPLLNRESCDFSFSGLKTAVRSTIRQLEEEGPLTPSHTADVCASFQRTVGEILQDRVARAIGIYSSRHTGPTLVVAGGVAANQYLRGILEVTATENHFRLVAPPISLCTDNAAMIAWAGMERLLLGLTDPLDSDAKARWPLDATG